MTGAVVNVLAKKHRFVITTVGSGLGATLTVTPVLGAGVAI